jgi:L-fuculose-phosphate aldolase
MGVFLERACRSQMKLLSTKQDYKATPKSELFAKKAQILDPNLVENFWSFFTSRPTPFAL